MPLTRNRMAAHFMLLQLARASESPIEVTEVGPGYEKSGSCAFVGLLGWVV